jgi:hypothetical protein
MRSVVLIHGLLTGMGQHEPCEMLAIKESGSAATEEVFSRCSVIDAPQELPDGDYRVSFNGHSVSARKEGGLWVPAEDALAMRAEQQSGDEQRHSFQIDEASEFLPIPERPTGRVA